MVFFPTIFLIGTGLVLFEFWSSFFGFGVFDAAFLNSEFLPRHLFSSLLYLPFSFLLSGSGNEVSFYSVSSMEQLTLHLSGTFEAIWSSFFWGFCDSYF